ncbi:MAG TPA: LytTR family transcriptional regulator [Bacteroidetes bacterium]|nr:LytTR family transcriptional regulator [Bacteroidota bacterium]
MLYICLKHSKLNRKKSIPDYFVNKKNSIIQILFTCVFAYFFILLYDPFKSSQWYQLEKSEFAFYLFFVVLIGMTVVVISRIILFKVYKKKKRISILFYITMIALEILFMAGIYCLLEKLLIKGPRSIESLYVVAIQNSTLILLIPYTISLLFFSWQANKNILEKTLNKHLKLKEKNHLFFHDENDKMKYSIDAADVLYLKSSDNYVKIYYLNNQEIENFMLRTNLKKLEEDENIFPLIRCHRSYMINAAKVKVIRRSARGLRAQLNFKNIQIPLGEKYKNAVLQCLQPSKQKKFKY